MLSATTTRRTASARNRRSSTATAASSRSRRPGARIGRPGAGVGWSGRAFGRGLGRGLALEPAALLGLLGDSSLALAAYMSTYSWPESRMISYMISSVIERRM